MPKTIDEYLRRLSTKDKGLIFESMGVYAEQLSDDGSEELQEIADRINDIAYTLESMMRDL